jgi:hypothetical protein
MSRLRVSKPNVPKDPGPPVLPDDLKHDRTNGTTTVKSTKFDFDEVQPTDSKEHVPGYHWNEQLGWVPNAPDDQAK